MNSILNRLIAGAGGASIASFIAGLPAPYNWYGGIILAAVVAAFNFVSTNPKPSDTTNQVKFVAILAVLGFGSAARCETQWSNLITYDLNAGKVIGGITYQPLATQTAVFGKRGFDVDPLLIAGSSTDGTGQLGGLLTSKFRFSDQTWLKLGFGGIVAPGEKPRSLIAIGIELRQ